MPNYVIQVITFTIQRNYDKHKLHIIKEPQTVSFRPTHFRMFCHFMKYFFHPFAWFKLNFIPQIHNSIKFRSKGSSAIHCFSKTETGCHSYILHSQLFKQKLISQTVFLKAPSKSLVTFLCGIINYYYGFIISSHPGQPNKQLNHHRRK